MVTHNLTCSGESFFVTPHEELHTDTETVFGRLHTVPEGEIFTKQHSRGRGKSECRRRSLYSGLFCCTSPTVKRSLLNETRRDSDQARSSAGGTEKKKKKKHGQRERQKANGSSSQHAALSATITPKVHSLPNSCKS